MNKDCESSDAGTLVVIVKVYYGQAKDHLCIELVSDRCGISTNEVLLS